METQHEHPNKDHNLSASPDVWTTLRAHTAARIALGHTGVAVPLAESLAFRMAHAHARDAVYSTLAETELLAALQVFQEPILTVHSQAAHRAEYLQRPDLGRQLRAEDVRLLEENRMGVVDVSIVLADGLSATAVNTHAVPLLAYLVPALRRQGFRLAPLVLAVQGRVAIGDAIGQALQARLVLVLIGERPGLSSPDSLGAYLTFGPRPGLTDEVRNCVSNIRPAGLSYAAAAHTLGYLIQEALRQQLTGVRLKDQSHLLGS